MSVLPPLSLDQPALYRIEVQGRLGEYAEWIGQAAEQSAIEVVEEAGAVTAVIARVADQAELHGILQVTDSRKLA